MNQSRPSITQGELNQKLHEWHDNEGNKLQKDLARELVMVSEEMAEHAMQMHPMRSTRFHHALFSNELQTRILPTWLKMIALYGDFRRFDLSLTGELSEEDPNRIVFRKSADLLSMRHGHLDVQVHSEMSPIYVYGFDSWERHVENYLKRRR